MKIAHFIDTETFGGAETLVLNLCRSLNRLGHSTAILHFGRNEKLSKEITLHGLDHRQLDRFREYKKSISLPLFCLYLRQELRNIDCDLFHTHLLGPCLAGALTRLCTRIPHVATHHDLYTIQKRPSFGGWLRATCFIGTRHVAVSPSVESCFRQTAHFPPGYLQTIPNGVEVPILEQARRESTRKELGISAGQLLVISVGRLAPIKQYDLLLRAFHQAHLGDGAVLVIAGDGPERQNLQNLIDSQNINARLIGFRADISQLLEASDCFALTSSTEGMSCSILEAMAHGLPVVATDVGGNSGIVKQGKTGVLVSQDPEDIALRLKQLLSNRQALVTMGDCGRRQITENFSLPLMVERYTKLYHLLARQ